MLPKNFIVQQADYPRKNNIFLRDQIILILYVNHYIIIYYS